MNRMISRCAATAALAGFLVLSVLRATAGIVSETEQDFFTTGDFNGDGKLDLVIVDRYTGRVRVGYQLSADFFDWANWKSGGMKGVTGVAVGRFLEAKRDAICLAGADANLVTIVDASNPNADSDPIKVPNAALGPNTVAAIDIGGTGNTPFTDLYLANVYDPMLQTLWRNDGKTFSKIVELPVAGTESRAGTTPLKTGGAEFVTVLSSGEKGNELLVKNLAAGKPEAVLSIGGLPANADYVVGNFRGTPLKEFVFFKFGEPTLLVSAVTEAGGKFQAEAPKTLTLAKPLRALISVDGEKKSRLLAVFGDREPAELMDFDGVNPPVTVQKLDGATNKFLNAALALPNALVLFSTITNDRPRFVTHYQMYSLAEGKYTTGSYGGLATLADRDDSTVPDIQTRIAANQVEKTQPDMKPYTNTIPGTDVKFEMVPIPGGEYVMGTPDSEKDRKPDEGPQHPVKIPPFWMGKFEVTWDAYLLFMYSDDEKKLRETHPTEAKVDEVSDAVTRPSKPYVDMSFGMGKSGFPAIAMTQHGANKFCHWLSARTGQFYRLPTEAEWEYACRAGTKTAYSFGDDPAQLPEYGWFFDNSDSKYQRVGKKKPNPWGLYDMHGNVCEWVLDQFDPNYYKQFDPQKVVTNPWNKATKAYPHSVRGGSWDDDPPALRSGARGHSDRSWKATDPQLPKSIWYLTDAKIVGFRLVRPLEVPPANEMVKYWTSGVEKD